MNRKSIIAIASCLSVCAVVGVGFSSWLIVNNTANASAEGSITVDTVEDKRVTISTEWVTTLKGATKNENPQIVFGAPTEAKNAANKWLIADSNAKTENLIVYLKITVTNATQLTNGLSYTVSEKKADGATGSYASAKQDGLVGDLPSGDIAQENINSGSYVQAITFTWGSAFGEKNPYTYYNAADKNVKDNGDEANTNLTKLNNYMSGISYTVTVETK